MSKIKTRIKRPPTRLFLILAVLFMITALSSCNVTRKVTTEQSYFQRGDTCTTITTRTVESYDASKKTF